MRQLAAAILAGSVVWIGFLLLVSCFSAEPAKHPAVCSGTAAGHSAPGQPCPLPKQAAAEPGAAQAPNPMPQADNTTLQEGFVPESHTFKPASKTTPQAGPPAATAQPTVTVLPNGLTVLTMRDDRFPLVSQRLYVRTGSAYETPEQAGISHLLEHMVFKGTHKRGPGEVAATVEGVGGYLNAATSLDYTVYYVDMPKQHWALGMDILQDMIFGAKIDPEELEREKEVVLAELKRGEDNPSQLLFKTVQTGVWDGSSYGRPVIGYRDTVRSLTSQDIHGYIAARYQPQNMLLAVVGDVDEAKALDMARNMFGNLKNDRELSPAPQLPAPKAGGPNVVVRSGEWNKVYLAMALPVPGQNADATAGLDVLAQMLGGDKSSYLYNRYKYQLQLVDDISLSTLSLSRGGILYLSASLPQEKLPEFWKTLAGDLAKLSAKDFSEQDLERAKLNLEDSLYRAKETLSGLASKVSYFQFFEGGQQAEDNYLYNVRSVDMAQIQEVLNTYLRPDRLTAVLLTPQGPDAEAAKDVSGTLKTVLQENWPAPEQTGEATLVHADTGVEVLDVGHGNKVVLTPDATMPYAAISLAWPGGDDLLERERDGLAELTARTLTRGTQTRSAMDIQRYLSERAANLNAGAGRDGFTINAKFPGRFADDMLGLLTEVLTKPAFAPDEVQRAVAEQTAAIQGREDQPLGLAFRNLFRFLFPDGRYGSLHLGNADALPGFGPEDLTAFWQTQAQRPFVLSVCGMYDRDQILALAQDISQALGSGGQDYAYPVPAFGADKEMALHLPGRNQTHLLRIFPVVGKEHPDSTGLELLRAALAGQSGLLFRDLRDKQSLGYTVTAFLWQAPKAGFMAFYIGTDPERRQEALAGFDSAVAGLKAAPLDETELVRAKNLLQGDYYRDHQSLGSRAGEAADLLSEGLDLDYNKDQVTKAQSLTPADLQRLARKYLNLEDSYLVSVDP